MGDGDNGIRACAHPMQKQVRNMTERERKEEFKRGPTERIPRADGCGKPHIVVY